MITIREIADNNSSISSTRWAFASVIVFDFVIISVAFVAFLVFHFIGKPLESSFFYGVATLLGILTALVTTSKSLQGFETKKNDKPMVTDEINVSAESDGK